MKIDFEKILKDKSLKVTEPRLVILKAFPDDCKPVNAEAVFKKVKSTIDQVTVYRTLNSFEEKGIICRVDLRKDSVYYELSDHHHHHIVCKECGMFEGFDLCELDNVTKKILSSSSKFKRITEHSFELFGVCKSCVKV